MPELEVDGLRNGDARALLGSAVRFMLDERVRDRIIAETRGNPLALLELPRGLTATRAGGRLRAAGRAGAVRADRGELRPTTRDAPRGRAAPAAGRGGGAGRRSAAAVARGRAARDRGGGGGSRGDGRAAGDRRAGDVPSSAGALGGVPIGGACRSAARSIWRWRRRPIGTLDPDRRAWHLAAAASGPDEEVALGARALGRAGAGARRARRGGRVPAARGRADARPDAADATARWPPRRPACRPARSTRHAGCWRRRRPGRSTSSSARAWTCCAPRSRSPRAAAATAPALLLRAAKPLEPLDPQLARETYLDAWSSALFAGRLASAASLHEVSRDARAAPRPAGAPRPSDLLLDGFSLAFTDGRAAAAPVLERAATGFAGERGLDRGGPPLGLARDRGRRDGVGLRDLPRGGHARGPARPRGRRADRAGGQRQRAWRRPSCWAGSSAARRCWSPRPTASPRRRAPASRRTAPSCSPASRAARPTRPALIDATIEEFTAGGQGTAVQYAQLGALGPPQRPRPLRGGAGRRAGGERRHARAVRLRLGAIELLEAARRCDEPELARDALERIVAATAVAPTDWALGDRGALPGAAERGRGRRAPVSRGDRAARPHPAASRARPRSSALRRVAAPRESPGRRARAAAHGPRDAHRDRHGGVRRARPAASCWRPARRCASAPSRRATS